VSDILKDILVVSLEQAVAAPFLTSRLADAGARVVKIERAEGDFARGYDSAAHGQSSYFVWLNRGKESAVLDIKDPEDAALLDAMIGRADVFVQNFAPGAAARAGFGSDDLRVRHPRLITVDISGYGEDGPYRDMKAYDLLIQSESGLAAITGTPAGPGRVGISVVDIAAGMYALVGTYQALLEREKTGRGKGIRVSLFDAMADWMTVPMLHATLGGKAPRRVGLHHPSVAPYGAYEAGDGGQVVIAVQNEREWARFCTEVLGRPDLAERPDFASNNLRVENRPAMDKEIDAALGGLTRGVLVERLAAARIAYGAVNSVEDLAAHPQLRLQTVPTPAGPVELAAPPVRESAGKTVYGPVPEIGAHTQALRHEFLPD